MLAENVLQMEQDNERLRAENEELRRLLGEDLPKPKNCEACKFYIQHYVRCGLQFTKTYAGHCVHGRNKDKKPDNKNCQYFQEK